MALNEKKQLEWEETLKEVGLMDADDGIEAHTAGDYYEKSFIFKKQVRGNLFFTKKRFVFCSGFGLTNLSILYTDIKGLKLTKISGIMPTGLEITINNEKGKPEKYTLSVMKRKEWLALLEEKSGIKAE